MTTIAEQGRKVARILSEWKGSDAGQEASPKQVAEEIDAVYPAHLAALPMQTAAIIAGQRDSERRAA